MKSVRFVCSFVILASVFVLTQSSRDQLANQSNGLHLRVPTNLPQRIPPAMSLRQLGAGEFETRAPWPGLAPKSGVNFAKAVAYGSGAELAVGAAVADVNGDGKPDIVVANLCAGIFNNGCPTNGSVAVMLGNGDGTFQTAVTYDSSGYYAYSVAIADVNGDGKPDILVANWCASSSHCQTDIEDSSVGVMLGNGDGTFQSVVTYDSGGDFSMSVAVADVNGDGKPDLLVVSQCVSNNCLNGGVVGVLLGNGDGTFEAVVTYGSGGYLARAVAVADFNGDGRPDLVVANCGGSSGCGGGNNDGTVGVLLGNGDGTFKAAVPYDSGGCNALSVAVADVNGDGIPDVLVANQGTTNTCGNGLAGVLLGNGDGTLKPVVTFGSGGWESSSVAVADINEDGNPDLLVANGCASSSNCDNGTVGILLGNGKGMFQRAVTFGSGGIAAGSVTAADVSGHGKPDLVIANNCTSGTGFNGCTNYTGAVGILINTTKISSGVTFSPTSLRFPDQVVFTTSRAQTVTLKNSGTGVLTIDRIRVTGPFEQTNNCPGTLYPNAHCRIKATFHPTKNGIQNGSVKVTDNASGSPQKVPLTGIGTLVKLFPTIVHFGTQPVGTRSLPRRIRLTNKGDAVVNIQSISVTGSDAGDFAEKNNCGKQVASGASCVVKVTFKPLMKGKRTAEISVKDDGGGSPQEVALTGTGT
jgi:hypothetical protein